jgi:hypothetical protein
MNPHSHVPIRNNRNQEAWDLWKERKMMATHFAPTMTDILTLEGGLKDPTTLEMDRPLCDTFAVMCNQFHLYVQQTKYD